AAFPDATTGENTANALAVDSKGNFYVSDLDPEQVDRFDPAGKLTMTFGTGRFNEQPGMMAITPDGRLFVDQGAFRGTAPGVLVFDANGTYITGFGTNGQGDLELVGPAGLLLLDGDLFVVDSMNPDEPSQAPKLIRLQLLPPLAP